LPDGIRPLIGSSRFQSALKTLSGLGAAVLLLTLLIQFIAGKYGPLPLQPLTGNALRMWVEAFVSPLDRDSALGIFMMLMVLTWRSRWLPYLRPLVNLVGLAIILSALGAGLIDLIYLPPPAERLWQGTRLLVLWEPVLMTLGMLAFYQMTLSLLTRLDRIPTLTRFLKALK
jgi:hypothetical protein